MENSSPDLSVRMISIEMSKYKRAGQIGEPTFTDT
jgi:hypothetical protein